MAFPPDVFLIGAQKAGTTTLADMLDRHPGITVADPKEPHFFTQNWACGLDWYRGCFPGREATLFVDASTSNAGAPLEDSERARRSPLAGVPRRIHQVSPEARFLYIVRDPVERTYSAYWHEVRSGDERRGFREAIEGDGAFLRVSDYAGQLGQFLAYFPMARFKILRFEDLRRAPEELARECFEFLGLEPPTEDIAPAGARNPSYTYNRLGRAVTRVLPRDRVLKPASRLARSMLPAGWYAGAGRLLTRDIPPMADADRRALEDYFRPRNRAFRELTGIETGYPE